MQPAGTEQLRALAHSILEAAERHEQRVRDLCPHGSAWAREQRRAAAEILRTCECAR